MAFQFLIQQSIGKPTGTVALQLQRLATRRCAPVPVVSSLLPRLHSMWAPASLHVLQQHRPFSINARNNDGVNDNSKNSNKKINEAFFWTRHKDVRWIVEDSNAVCKFHPRCKWVINLVFTNYPLMKTFEDTLWESEIPSSVFVQAQVTDQPFSKFGIIREYVNAMDHYDLVLIKDNDLRLNGFPWQTFLQKRGSAIVSGPLRQETEGSLIWRFKEPKPWFQFHSVSVITISFSG